LCSSFPSAQARIEEAAVLLRHRVRPVSRSHLMIRRGRRFAQLFVLAGFLFAAASEKEASGGGPTQVKSPLAQKKLADGVYAVLRDSVKEKDVLPLEDGEALLVHRHRYLKKDQNEPPRYLVVPSAPTVTFDLVGQPKAVK